MMIDLTLYYDDANQKLLLDERQISTSKTLFFDAHAWIHAYHHGYYEPRYPMPAVRRVLATNLFDFYFKMGFVNAMCDDMIERERRDAAGINRR